MKTKSILCALLLMVGVSTHAASVLPVNSEVGIEMSYEGERHVQMTTKDYQNLFFSGFALFQETREVENGVLWKFTIRNDSKSHFEVGSLWFTLSAPPTDNGSESQRSYATHYCIAGNASYIYWCPYSGADRGVLMTAQNTTSLEYLTQPDFTLKENRFYIHGKWAVDPNDTWRMPLSSIQLAPGEQREYSFLFTPIKSRLNIDQQIVENGGLTMRVAPGMVHPKGKEVLCAFSCKDSILSITPEFPGKTSIERRGKTSTGKELIAFKFQRLGENQVVVEYGNHKKAYLEFFATKPFEQLIQLRSEFITKNQQVRDTTKWYDGLYSIWDMKTRTLMNPDEHHHLPEYAVGGSDDPTNSKPVYVSEKNVFYPNKKEIEALEYYEDNFVYGKLQRTGDETPYPYGIYGSENWHQNRSGKYGSMDSGGWGLQRLWRTYDYVTHMALYYNLYLIASGNPSLTKHPASYWLDLAYNTTMAFYKVPYNIYMERFAHKGWCDWAYKTGNFHERYLLEIMDALRDNGQEDRAEEIRAEWEKKVLYFMYDDPWPFGSEYAIDRTAYESSYYVADYGMRHYIEPKQNLWQDKNSGKWYSYDSYDAAVAEKLMQNQLRSNLAIRGITGLHYWKVGSAWASTHYTLEYMTPMGGAAILDYAFRYSTDPARYINYGYNSLYGSWALVNTGYWSKYPQNYGASGWNFADTQNGWYYTYEMVSTKRGPFRYDGEVDHGFTGGVHAAGTYVVDDPDFGTIAYGGNLKIENNAYQVVPQDGICRRIFFRTPVKAGVELRQDAFDGKEPVVMSSDGSTSFYVVNRYGSDHTCHVRLWSYPQGTYEIYVDGNLVKKNTVTGDNIDQDFAFPLGKKRAFVEVISKG